MAAGGRSAQHGEGGATFPEGQEELHGPQGAACDSKQGAIPQEFKNCHDYSLAPRIQLKSAQKLDKETFFWGENLPWIAIMEKAA